MPVVYTIIPIIFLTNNAKPTTYQQLFIYI